MDEFVWTLDLITGNEIIDFQHKKLFDYVNILIIASSSKDPHNLTTKETIDALIEYAVLHFDDEELVLESIEYPDLVAHQKLHGDFANKVVDFRTRLESGEDVINELVLFVKDWLVVHVKQEDMKALKRNS